MSGVVSMGDAHRSGLVPAAAGRIGVECLIMPVEDQLNCVETGWLPQSAAGQTRAIKPQQCEDVRRTGLILAYGFPAENPEEREDLLEWSRKAFRLYECGVVDGVFIRVAFTKYYRPNLRH